MTSRKTDRRPVFTCHSLYGKILKSQFRLPLPSLPPQSLPLSRVSDRQPDISIVQDRLVPRTLDHSPVPQGREWITRSDHHIMRFYDRDGHLFEYVISDNGARISVSQSWPVWQDSVFALLNMVMGAAITIRGQSMLHACSLVDDGRAFLIMGESGAGKSSLSVSLAAGGMAVQADDVAVIENIRFDGPPKDTHPKDTSKPAVAHSLPTSSNIPASPHTPPSPHTPASPHQPAPSISKPYFTSAHPVIAAGYPRIKIKPSLPGKLGLNGINSIRIATVDSAENERWLNTDELPGGTFRDPAPLGGIFILRKRGQSDQKHPKVERLDPMPAAVALTGHVYGGAWFNPPGPRNLFICTDIAGRVPVFTVTLPDNLSRLRDSARYLLDHYIRPISAS